MSPSRSRSLVLAVSTLLLVPVGVLAGGPSQAAAAILGSRVDEPGAVGEHPPRRAPQPRGGPAVLPDGGGGRPLPRDRVPHPRRDGRLLDAADQAARRSLVQGRRRLAGRPGRRVTSYTSGWGYQRMDLGTHDGVDDHAARTSCRARCGPGSSACTSRPRPATRLAAHRRRALRADEGLPLGRDQAVADGVQPRRHRRGHATGTALPGAGAPRAPERRAARLRRGGRVDDDADGARRRTRLPGPPGRGTRAPDDLPRLWP